MNKVRDVSELYALADKCAQAEEGRRFPSKDAGTEIDSEGEDATTSTKKGRRRNKERRGKAVLAVEGPGNTSTAKKIKADGPGKEVAGCVSCLALAAADKPEASDK